MADWSPRCCECGRFVRYDCDRSAPFGGPTDFEPPDDEFYCDNCAKYCEEYYVAAGWVPSDLLKSNWQRRAAKRLGLVVAGPKGAAWSVWVKPDKIPEHWETRHAADEVEGVK